MTKGFVTIATGDERYYKMALNLLISYRHFSKSPMPFAIMADTENQYTEQFDAVVIPKKTYRSFMDKIELVTNLPFDENIFIDADCLAYRDLNDYWKYFENADDFSVFGEAYPLDSERGGGWFLPEDTGELREKIHFITHLHGGIYFIRKSSTCEPLYRLCSYITENYHHFKFRMFDQPADEPIFALAMSVLNLKPVSVVPGLQCFYPCVTYFRSKMEKGEMEYSVPWFDGKIVKDGYCVHWGNFNIDRAIYKTEVYKLLRAVRHKKINPCAVWALQCVWNIALFMKTNYSRAIRFIKRLKKKN